MSELLAKDRRIVERCRATIAFVSTVFHGHATDMNVHPTDDRTTVKPNSDRHSGSVAERAGSQLADSGSPIQASST